MFKWNNFRWLWTAASTLSSTAFSETSLKGDLSSPNLSSPNLSSPNLNPIYQFFHIYHKIYSFPRNTPEPIYIKLLHHKHHQEFLFTNKNCCFCLQTKTVFLSSEFIPDHHINWFNSYQKYYKFPQNLHKHFPLPPWWVLPIKLLVTCSVT